MKQTMIVILPFIIFVNCTDSVESSESTASRDDTETESLSGQPLEISEWQVPWSGRPRDPYVAPDGNVFFVGFDPASESFFASLEIESGGGTVRHMVFHNPTQSIWFGTDTNYLGRAVVSN